MVHRCLTLPVSDRYKAHTQEPCIRGTNSENSAWDQEVVKEGVDQFFGNIYIYINY